MSEAEKKQRKCLVVVRVRGTVRGSREARETLMMLHLTHNNHATLIDDRPAFLGMLKAAQNFVTWGEPSKAAVAGLIEEKGRLAGDKSLTDEYAQKAGCKSLEELAEAVHGCRVEYWGLPGIKKFFRLHPPSKGFKGNVKKGFTAGGELGYRGEKVNELLQRML